MTGLRVWLHPSSRTIKTVVGLWSFVIGLSAPAVANDRRPKTNDAFLHSTAFWRTAAVMRDRRGVLDVTHFDAGRGQRTNGGFAPRTGAADSHFNAAHTVIARHHGGIRCRLLGCKRRSLA